MNLNEVKKYVEKSVLCWLATSSLDHQPNVSPKEVFTFYEKDCIIIANIASPQSAKNIKHNPKVSLSFIDVFEQKGCKIMGSANVISSDNDEFETMEMLLNKITQGKYPFKTIFKICISDIKPIVAPSYFFYPEVSDEVRILNAKRGYGIDQE